MFQHTFWYLTLETNSPPHLYQYGWVLRVFGPTSLHSATNKERKLEKQKSRKAENMRECEKLLTWSTSCRKEAGSTQLIRRSNRSIIAEASICFSTRPIKPSFFFRKAITYKQKSHHLWLEPDNVSFFVLKKKKKQDFNSVPVQSSLQWDCLWFYWRNSPIEGWEVGPVPGSDIAPQAETHPRPAYHL